MPLPVIAEPFRRIAMDKVGPLLKSRSGKKYVLVLCDYASRYPEAIPMKAIDAEHVAEELVILFSRVGVPEEILTDQGANFTSKLLTELYRMLHVHPIRTTPEYLHYSLCCLVTSKMTCKWYPMSQIKHSASTLLWKY